jgi:hypothetical protein
LPGKDQMSSALTHFRTVMAGFPRLTHVPSGGKAKLRTVTRASYNMLIPEWREATRLRPNLFIGRINSDQNTGFCFLLRDDLIRHGLVGCRAVHNRRFLMSAWHDLKPRIEVDHGRGKL